MVLLHLVKPLLATPTTTPSEYTGSFLLCGPRYHLALLPIETHLAKRHILMCVHACLTTLELSEGTDSPCLCPSL